MRGRRGVHAWSRCRSPVNPRKGRSRYENVRGTRDTEREGLSSRTGSMRALGMRESQGATRRTESANTDALVGRRGWTRVGERARGQGGGANGRKRGRGRRNGASLSPLPGYEIRIRHSGAHQLTVNEIPDSGIRMAHSRVVVPFLVLYLCLYTGWSTFIRGGRVKMKKEFDEKFRKRKNENETRLDFAIIVILYNFSYFLFTDYA